MAGEMLVQLLREAIQVPGLLKEVYGDLAKPGVTQVGKALGTVIGLGNTVLWPIYWANKRVESAERKTEVAIEINLEKYRHQLQAVPEEKIIQVVPEVGVPLLEKLSYVTNDEISDLYINLLAKASTVDTVGQAHPAFVNIINHLCPDEAILLKEFRSTSIIFGFVYRRVQTQDEWRLFISPEIRARLSFPFNISVYASNLQGLGITEFHQSRTALGHTEEEIRQLHERFVPEIQQEYQQDPERGGFDKEFAEIRITPFGRLFINACLKKLNEA